MPSGKYPFRSMILLDKAKRRIYAIRLRAVRSTHFLGADAPAYFGAFIQTLEFLDQLLRRFQAEVAAVLIDFFAGMRVGFKRTGGH